MERITDKLKKLLALAERGCGGEAENARRLLEEHLRKYGMTLEDICENNISRRTFKYRNKEERTIIIQVFLRAARYMETRKVAKTHQHILVFFKGNPKDIKKEYPKIEYTEEDMVQFEATETSSESETTENE